jgi:hypothetical protein
MLESEGIDNSKQEIAQRRKGLFTIVGSIAGIAALLWNIWWTISNAQNSYLQLALDVHPINGATAVAQTSIENKSELSKTMDYAALIVSPAGKDIREVVSGLRGCSGESSPINFSAEPASTVLKFWPTTDTPLYCDGELSIVPLTFFYKEQKQIGNEKMSSCNLINIGAFRHSAEPSSSYDVRFVVRGEGRMRETLALLVRESAPI